MSYQVEISKSEFRYLIFALAIVPCLLFSAGFLTASLSQDGASTAIEVVASEPSITSDVPEQEILEAPAIATPSHEPTPQESVVDSMDTAALKAPVTLLAQDRLFSVQTAAFHSAGNAINFAAQLKTKGYPAEVTVLFEAPEAPVYKVVYGTFAHEEAIKAAMLFTQEEKIPAFIIARS